MTEEFDYDAVVASLMSTPPDCLKGLSVSHTELPEKFSNSLVISSWTLACKCGCETGRLLGYPIQNCQDSSEPADYVSPLSFQCSACDKSSVILDTHVNGYHGEGNGSTKIYGTGLAEKFHCPQCQSIDFSFALGFFFLDGAFDLFAEAIEDGELTFPMQNFFNEFLCYGRCNECKKVTLMSALDNL